MAQPNETNASTVHEGAHGGGEFPPFNTATYPAQIVWLVLTFGFLYVMMARAIVPRLSGIIADRRGRIAADLSEASAMRAGAEEAGRAYETSLAEARGKAQAIAQQTRDTLSAEAETRRKSMEADLSAKLASAEAEIRARTESAMGRVDDIAAEAAGAIVERLTGRPADPARVRAAFSAAGA